MISRILLFVVVVGGFYFLLFGLTDAQINSFKHWRHVWVGRFYSVEKTTRLGWKKID